jgi:hypothetical protein
VPALPRITPLAPVHPLIGYVTLGAGGVALLRLELPAAGRLVAEATGHLGRRTLVVARVKRTLAHATSITLRLAPSRPARRALRRRRTLAVRLAIRYSPRHGASTRAQRRYTLGGGAGG